ncbi:expressed unknown protein [Seminavis robusta]|uniref:Secreted protein n=1 Tax=Seminavis robusta TaxID=568900 RepID=A0A9N8ELR5_9STRA|nr:expressed unknown protein [Seminavis robusta]|eukprot:Sro1416_g270870.1 n/a (184) ;mRNA; f:19950-20501
MNLLRSFLFLQATLQVVASSKEGEDNAQTTRNLRKLWFAGAANDQQNSNTDGHLGSFDELHGMDLLTESTGGIQGGDSGGGDSGLPSLEIAQILIELDKLLTTAEDAETLEDAQAAHSDMRFKVEELMILFPPPQEEGGELGPLIPLPGSDGSGLPPEESGDDASDDGDSDDSSDDSDDTSED